MGLHIWVAKAARLPALGTRGGLGVPSESGGPGPPREAS